MKLPKKRRCVVAVQQPRRNQKRRGANVDGGAGDTIFSISFVISSVAIRKRWRGGNSEYSNSKDLEMSKSRLSFSFFSNFLSLYILLGGEIFPRRINAVKHHHNNNSGMVAGLGGGGGQFMLICRAISNILTSVIFYMPVISYTILCII